MAKVVLRGKFIDVNKLLSKERMKIKEFNPRGRKKQMERKEKESIITEDKSRS